MRLMVVLSPAVKVVLAGVESVTNDGVFASRLALQLSVEPPVLVMVIG